MIRGWRIYLGIRCSQTACMRGPWGWVPEVTDFKFNHSCGKYALQVEAGLQQSGDKFVSHLPWTIHESARQRAQCHLKLRSKGSGR